ncbi:MAG: polyphosphate kinase 2, partial [Burkholderia sp.]
MSDTRIEDLDAEARQRRLEEDLVDAYDEELEMELDDRRFDGEDTLFSAERRESRKAYFRELFRLQGELVKLQDW